MKLLMKLFLKNSSTCEAELCQTRPKPHKSKLRMVFWLPPLTLAQHFRVPSQSIQLFNYKFLYLLTFLVESKPTVLYIC
jgi:hypothetical protein